MSIKITTDSSCDLTKSLLDNHNIDVASLSVIDGTENKNYLDGEITIEELISLLQKNHKITTSCPSIGAYQDMFLRNLKSYEHIIHLSMSSGISGSYSAAREAASEISKNKITVIDTKHMTIALGLLNLKLAGYVASSSNINEVVKEINEDIEKTYMMVILDTIKYAKNGGRVNDVKARLLDTFKIKATVNMENGKIKSLPLLQQRQYRGTSIEVATARFNDILNSNGVDLNNVVVGSTATKDQLLNLRSDIMRNHQIKDLINLQAGCVIGSHAGPDAYAIAYQKTIKKI